MEKLEKLLMDYNLQHIDDLIVSPWSKQYCRTPFPLYWQKVYDIMEKIDRKYYWCDKIALVLNVTK